MTAAWGLLPTAVRSLILTREWENKARLKARLLGRKSFPIQISLKPPSAPAAIDHLAHFQHFIHAWQTYPHQHWVQWEDRSYRQLGQQRVPKFFVLDSVQALIQFIGDQAVQRSQRWEQNMSPLLAISSDLYPTLIKHLDKIESMQATDSQLLADLITQLSPGLGIGQYLRALPLVGIDTKFLEYHQTLIADILDVLHQQAVSNAGGLLQWLGCYQNPKGWLMVRPLCQETTLKMGQFPLLQLPTEVLRQQVLPAQHILVVENIQSGLGLPKMNDTIAVFGGGQNVAWMDATWLKQKHVAYWGDIDTWGLAILSQVRSKLSTVTALMMDKVTLERYQSRMVNEPKPVENLPEFLTTAETQLFLALKANHYGMSRLEQERLPPDYIHDQLDSWLNP